MLNLHRHLVLATALAAGLAIVRSPTGPASAEERATVRTDPGFKPDTGQINPGANEQAYSEAPPDVRNVRSAPAVRSVVAGAAGAEPTRPHRLAVRAVRGHRTMRPAPESRVAQRSSARVRPQPPRHTGADRLDRPNHSGQILQA